MNTRYVYIFLAIMLMAFWSWVNWLVWSNS